MKIRRDGQTNKSDEGKRWGEREGVRGGGMSRGRARGRAAATEADWHGRARMQEILSEKGRVIN